MLLSMFRAATLFCLCALTLPNWAGAAPLPITPVERALAFSSCAGRFSATAEFRYLFPDRDPSAAEARRDLFAEMLEAVLPHAIDAGLPPALPLSIRIEAKAAQADLLHRAAFSADVLASVPARKAADRYIAECEAMLLGA
jgi:hypothetical protein